MPERLLKWCLFSPYSPSIAAGWCWEEASFALPVIAAMVRWPRIYIWSDAPYLCKEMSDFKKKSSSGLLGTYLINHSEHGL